MHFLPVLICMADCVYLYVYVLWVYVYMYCVHAHSALLLAGPRESELRQPYLSRAARFGKP